MILHDPFWRPLSVTREAHRLGRRGGRRPSRLARAPRRRHPRARRVLPAGAPPHLPARLRARRRGDVDRRPRARLGPVGGDQAAVRSAPGVPPRPGRAGGPPAVRRAGVAREADRRHPRGDGDRRLGAAAVDRRRRPGARRASKPARGGSGSRNWSSCGRSSPTGAPWPGCIARRHASSPPGPTRRSVWPCSRRRPAAPGWWRAPRRRPRRVAGPLVQTFSAKDPVDLARAIDRALATPLDLAAAAALGSVDELGAGVRSRAGRPEAPLPVAALGPGAAGVLRAEAHRVLAGNWREGTPRRRHPVRVHVPGAAALPAPVVLGLVLSRDRVAPLPARAGPRGAADAHARRPARRVHPAHDLLARQRRLAAGAVLRHPLAARRPRHRAHPDPAAGPRLGARRRAARPTNPGSRPRGSTRCACTTTGSSATAIPTATA